MKYVIWNQTQNKFWNKGNENDQKGHWTNRYYATKYSQEEIEKIASQVWFDGSGDVVFAMIALMV